MLLVLTVLKRPVCYTAKLTHLTFSGVSQTLSASPYGGVTRPSDLLSPRQVFPHGLPEEFTLVFTVVLKKAALRDTIYLFQISDQQGYPQVQPAFIFCHAYVFLHPFAPPLLPPSPFLSLPVVDFLAFIPHTFLSTRSFCL